MSYSSSLILPYLTHLSKADTASGGADNGSVGLTMAQDGISNPELPYLAREDYLQTKISGISLGLPVPASLKIRATSL